MPMSEDEIRALEAKAQETLEELKELKYQRPVTQMDPVRFHQEVFMRITTRVEPLERYIEEALFETNRIVKAWYEHMLKDDGK